MVNTVGRNLNLCFTKIKLTTPESPPSIPEDRSRPSPTPTFIKNFNSLFDLTALDSAAANSDSDSPSPPATSAPDFASAIASRRFFFSSPGRSNSIIDSFSPSSSSSSYSSRTEPAPSEPDNVVGGGVAVPTFSPDPYSDFRKSMEEMVAARGLYRHGVRESWDQLHELLTCYLALNPKSTHKFILAAFSDLLVSLMSSPPPPKPSDVN